MRMSSMAFSPQKPNALRVAWRLFSFMEVNLYAQERLVSRRIGIGDDVLFAGHHEITVFDVAGFDFGIHLVGHADFYMDRIEADRFFCRDTPPNGATIEFLFIGFLGSAGVSGRTARTARLFEMLLG